MTFGEAPSRFAEAAPLLLPALRGPTSPTGAWERALSRPDLALVRRPFAPFLDVCLVLDHAELRRFVHRAHLEDWGVDEAVAFQVAASNLPPATGLGPWPEAPGVWQLDARDGHVASRLVLPGFLRSFVGRVPGRPIALAPDVQTLLIVGEDAGLPLLRALEWTEHRFFEAGTPISLAPYTLQDDAVVPWVPPEGHMARSAALTRHHVFAGHEYRRQHAPLVGWLSEHGSPDRVATFSLLKRAGATVTFACWTGGPTLLPRVAYVALGPPSGALTSRWVPWDDLVATGVIGDPEPDLAPVRYRVERYPAAWTQGPATAGAPTSPTGLPIS